MKSPYQALRKFLDNPKENKGAVLPYLKSLSEPWIRTCFEFLRLESKSKPYPGHADLLKSINFRDGYYVVCGGNDGYGFDPTYYLEKFKNWSGIIIEPLPQTALACQKNRPGSHVEQVALVSNDHVEGTIDIYDCNFMSVTSSTKYNIDEWMMKGAAAQGIVPKKICVPAKTLDAILEQNLCHQSIDLLVIDVEGSEEEVLRGFDIAKYRPRFILIEIHTPSQKQAIESLLGGSYTLIEKIDKIDYLYESL